MGKVVLPEITSGYASVDKLNEAFQTIEQAFDNTLSLDGSVPNSMSASLDMNSQRILNLPTPTSDSEPATLGILREMSSGVALCTLEKFTASVGQTDFALSTTTYEPGSNNLAVFVNGVRKFTPDDFTETSPTTFSFVSPLTGGEKVWIVTNEYLGSVDVTTPPSVAWSILTGVPAFASRWPTWGEVTSKPSVFPPDTHNQDASTITTGTLADARRGVYVQSTAPSLGTGDAGALWFW
jgi:hypothetical protein